MFLSDPDKVTDKLAGLSTTDRFEQKFSLKYFYLIGNGQVFRWKRKDGVFNGVTLIIKRVLPFDEGDLIRGLRHEKRQYQILV